MRLCALALVLLVMSAAVDIPLGAGRMLMFATHPMDRRQNFGEHRLLYNAVQPAAGDQWDKPGEPAEGSHGD